MRSLILITLLVAAFSSGIQEQLMRDLFEQWKLSNSKFYGGFENDFRFQIFAQNYLDILEFNAKQDDVTLGLNTFADLTAEEFSNLYTGFNAKEHTGPFHSFEEVNDFPASVDWRTKGAVTPVKNQGSCGSCWAFSATGALEGLYFLNNSNLVSFSEQQLVDCVTADQGCNGGLPSDAMAYTAQNGGIDTEADYPYKGVNGKCHYDSSQGYNANSGYFNVTPSNLDQMKAAIVSQPVSVGIQANQLVFQFYTGGVIKKFCGDTLDHGVLVVGYDTISGTEAFIVKNSWGGTWGNSGYVYISTDASANKGKGVCGILSMPVIPSK